MVSSTINGSSRPPRAQQPGRDQRGFGPAAAVRVERDHAVGELLMGDERAGRSALVAASAR